VNRAVATLAALALVLGGCTNDEPASPEARRARQRATIERIRVQVARVRGLPWRARPAVHIVPRAEVRLRWRETQARHARAERDLVVDARLRLLKLIPAHARLRGEIERLLDARVDGLYDADTKQVYVAADPTDDLSSAARVTLAHELDHALTDQHYGFGAVADLLHDAGLDEELVAYSALIEGDAVLVQSLWAERYLAGDDAPGSLDAELRAAGGARPSRYVEDVLVFPYTKGLEFAFDRYRTTRTFSGVDAAWRRRPSSTEEILHPARYTAVETWSRPPLPDLGPAGCRAEETSTLGELGMRELLERFLTARDAARATDGWAGDAFAFARCDSHSVFVERWTADDPDRANRLVTTLRRWSRAWSGGPERGGSFAGPRGAGLVRLAGNRVDLVLATDRETAARVGAILTGGGD
jgi:hypothetical protein